MANVLDYILWRGDLTFSKSELNEVDNLFLSELSYIDFTDIVVKGLKINIGDAYLKYMEIHKHEDKKKIPAYLSSALLFFERMAVSSRFRDLIISDYVQTFDHKKEKQFAAITIHIGRGMKFVSYRGTDDSLIGWKEDLNLSFLSETPAQKSAIDYLNRVRVYKHTKLIVGGHSKGGNLAIYASLKCKPKIQEHIVKVYCNDGPGFTSDMVSESDYENMKGKICTIFPYESVVGMLLSHDEHSKVIASKGSNMAQHLADHWEVMGTKFVEMNGHSGFSLMVKKSVDAWLQKVDVSSRSMFVDTLFQLFFDAKIYYLSDFSGLKPNEFLALLKSGKELDRNNQNILTTTVASFWSEGKQAIMDTISEFMEKNKPKSSLVDRILHKDSKGGENVSVSETGILGTEGSR